MQVDTYTSVHALSALGGEDAVTIARRQELQQKQEERMALQISREMQKIRRSGKTDVVKVGFILPTPQDTQSGEVEIKRELAWWEDEMQHRENMRLAEAQREELHMARLKELAEKEARLEELKAMWEAKNDQILLAEEELVTIQKDFEEKIKLELEARAKAPKSSGSSTHVSSRMQEEAERRSIRKNLRRGSIADPEVVARNKILKDVEEVQELEREILRVRRDAGLMRQRLQSQVKSQTNNMNDEKKRRQEKYAEHPLEIPPLEELYAPKVVPPRPVIPRAHEARLLEAQRLKAERLAARQQSSSSAKVPMINTATTTTSNISNNAGSSSSSSSGKGKL